MVITFIYFYFHLFISIFISLFIIIIYLFISHMFNENKFVNLIGLGSMLLGHVTKTYTFNCSYINSHPPLLQLNFLQYHVHKLPYTFVQ